MGKWVIKLSFEDVRKYVEKNSDCIMLSTEYNGTKKKLSLKCKCGEIFFTTFEKFKLRNKRQCNKCGVQKRVKYSSYDIEYIKNIIKETSNCKYISGEYINDMSILTLQCGCGNLFNTSYRYFRSNNKRQCYNCGDRINAESKSKYTYEYVENLLKDNGCTLITDKTNKYITIKEKILVQCSCLEFFITTLEMINAYNKLQCNSCSFKKAPQSKGSIKIQKYLDNLNINYKREYAMDDCKNKYKLRFDFAIFDDNNNLKFLLEFDGKQHFESVDYWGGEDGLLLRKERDMVKNLYCEEKNIKLLRIPYYDIDKIESVLNKYIA